MNFNYLKNLNFKHRKAVHYTLLACIILLQILVITIWYNETSNEDKLNKAFENAATSSKIDNYTGTINTTIVESQKHFNNYINTKDSTSLNNYIKSLRKTSSLIHELQLSFKDSDEFKSLLLKKNNTEKEIFQIKSSIDSIVNKQIYPTNKDVLAPFEYNNYPSNKILDDIKTDTYIKVDSVSKKGLFSRIADAFSGKVEIQKEQLNTVITMKFNNKIKKGTIEEQFKNLITSSNQYYQQEFQRLKNAFLNLRKKDMQLINFNNQLLELSNTILPSFTQASNSFKIDNENNLKNQYNTNKAIRNYSIVAVIILMLIISFILFGFTKLAFEYENRLTLAQEKISRNLNFKNRIIGMISHEIRSPLNILSIYSEKASKTVTEITHKNIFNSIQFTTNSLLLLSNQLLEYSKDDNHKVTLNNKDFFLKTELEQIIGSITSIVESKENKIKTKINLSEDYEVHADKAKIHQLFYNIIGNANKFTQKGLIEVQVDEGQKSEYEVNLSILIKDNGIGIAKSDLENIFEPFYQGTVSDKVDNLGVGLGLNLCKEIVELFDGEIIAKSEANKGTEFNFNLVLSKV